MSLLIDRVDRSYVLVTGGTGLVGQYLIRELLSAQQRIALVVRPGKKLSARQRVEGIMQRWEAETGLTLPRPIVLAGDVSEPNLGLDQESLDWVEVNCGRVIHSAAVLTFHGASREHDPWRTNLGGTKHVLKLCREFAIDELHYLSTAYVCGKRTERVMEDDLDCQQEFRNDYEQCKFEAEQLVHAADYISSKTIYRPAVIVGDSQTGFTATYHGLFLYLRLVATLVPMQKRNAEGVIETPLRLPMHGTEPRNLIPVDWVAAVVAHLFLTPEAHGRTYHLTPDQCSTFKGIVDHCCDFYGSRGVEFVGPDGERDADSQFAAKYFENTTLYEDYETSDPNFDKTYLNKFAGHLKCPPVDRGMIQKFIEFGTSDRWGKRREKLPTVACDFAEQLDALADVAEVALPEMKPEAPIGIDLRGAGGGQWRIMLCAEGNVKVMKGLPSTDCPVIVAETQDLISENGELTLSALFEDAADGEGQTVLQTDLNESSI